MFDSVQCTPLCLLIDYFFEGYGKEELSSWTQLDCRHFIRNISGSTLYNSRMYSKLNLIKMMKTKQA